MSDFLTFELEGVEELRKGFEQAAEGMLAALAGGMFLEGEAIMAASKREVPVDEGTLRASGFVKAPKIRRRKILVTFGYGGAAKAYACIGSQSSVTTKGGLKKPASVKVGDEVLTQAGVWKPVQKVFEYELETGARLVQIRSTWRAGTEHRLEVTDKHHILVYRGGRNKWVKASDVRVGDTLYQKRTEPLPNVRYVSVNPGTATYVEPGTFEFSEVTEVRHEVYQYRGEGPRKKVWDFQVADIPSYTASGIVVHNSYLHEGTGPAVGRPPFFPPVKPIAEWAGRVLGDASLGFVIARSIGQKGLKPRKYLEKPFRRRVRGMGRRLATHVRGSLGG